MAGENFDGGILFQHKIFQANCELSKGKLKLSTHVTVSFLRPHSRRRRSQKIGPSAMIFL